MHSVAFGRLRNGLRVVTIQRPHLHRSVVSTYIDVGSRHETPRTNGLSHFLEHMLFRGTSRYPTAYAVNDVIERLGGTLSAATHGDYTLFDMSVPPDGIEGACRLMGEIFTDPVFSQIDVEKGIVREEILESLDDDHVEANPDNLSRLQLFGAHPMGYPITGTLDNVERFSTRDLRAHLRRYYRAGNMVVSICSPLGHRAVMRAVERGFATLPAGTAPDAREVRIAQRRPRLGRIESAGAQTSVRLAFPTPGEQSPLARQVDVLMRTIDDGMSTRLHRRICDELGLAYDVSAGVEMFRDVGVMDVASNVAHGSVAKLVREVLRLLGDLAIDGPSKSELEKVQHRYAFDLAALDDDPRGLADFYGAPALWNHRMNVATRRRDVLRLTVDDLRNAARVVFAPSRLNLIMVGHLDAASPAALREQIDRFRIRLRGTVDTNYFAHEAATRSLRVRRRAAALDSIVRAP